MYRSVMQEAQELSEMHDTEMHTNTDANPSEPQNSPVAVLGQQILDEALRRTTNDQRPPVRGRERCSGMEMLS